MKRSAEPDPLDPNAPGSQPGGLALYLRFNRYYSSIIQQNARQIGISDYEMIKRMVDNWDRDFPRDKAAAGLLSSVG